MNQPNQNPISAESIPEPKSVSILDLLIILLEYKRVFIISMIVFSIAGIVTSLIIPKTFQATAVILKPDRVNGLASLLGGNIPGGSLLKSMDFLGGSDNADKYISMLNSRRIAEAVIDHFNLVHKYGFDKRNKYCLEDIIKAFRQNYSVMLNENENIAISVTDSSPSLTAAIANFVVNQLDSMSYSLSKERARYSIRFFSERLKIINSDLDSASARFTEFQTKHKYYEMKQQISASIEALAILESKKIGSEVELAQIKSQFGGDHLRATELNKTIQTLDNSIKKYIESGDGNLLIALKNSPQRAVEYARLYRDVKIQEALYELVVQMYEQAKFTEANNTPSIQVLEWAKVPQKRKRPKRVLICILFFTVGMCLTTIGIVIMAFYKNEKSIKSDYYLKINKLISLIKR